MKSFNHKCIKVRSSMKANLLYISIIYELIIILFHLQHYLQVVSVTISTKWHSNVIIVYNITIQWLNYYYLLTHFITMLMIPMQQALPLFQLPCSEYTNVHAQLINEYTYKNGVQFEINSS